MTHYPFKKQWKDFLSGLCDISRALEEVPEESIAKQFSYPN